MPFKILIAGTVVIVSFFLGNSFAASMKKREDYLRELIGCLLQMESYIGSTSMPLGRIYERLSGTSGDCGRFFSKLKQLTEERNSQPICWEKSLPELKSLTKEDRQPLQELSCVLGAEDGRSQLSHLKLCRDRLELQLKQAENCYRTNGKLYRQLGFLGGLFLVVILI